MQNPKWLTQKKGYYACVLLPHSLHTDFKCVWLTGGVTDRLQRSTGKKDESLHMRIVEKLSPGSVATPTCLSGLMLALYQVMQKKSFWQTRSCSTFVPTFQLDLMWGWLESVMRRLCNASWVSLITGVFQFSVSVSVSLSFEADYYWARQQHTSWWAGCAGWGCPLSWIASNEWLQLTGPYSRFPLNVAKLIHSQTIYWSFEWDSSLRVLLVALYLYFITLLSVCVNESSGCHISHSLASHVMWASHTSL